LSSISNDKASVTVATTAPNIMTLSGKPGNSQPTIRQVTRNASEPSSDLFRNLCFPNLLPIKAEEISPKMINDIAIKNTGLENNSAVIQAVGRI